MVLITPSEPHHAERLFVEDGAPHDALPHVEALAKSPSCRLMVVYSVEVNGNTDVRSFGSLRRSDMAYLGAVMQRHAANQN